MRRSGNRDVHLVLLDLGSLASVRRFVDEVRRRENSLHVLVNNAAAAGMANEMSQDGLQQEVQINHFGPMLLTLLLLGRTCCIDSQSLVYCRGTPLK